MSTRALGVGPPRVCRRLGRLAVVVAFLLGVLVSAEGPGAAAASNVMVPVVACPSEYGAGPPTGLPILPKAMGLGLPAAAAGKLSFYTDHTRTLAPVLAPRGWACNVLIGADGSGGVNIYPHGRPQPGPTSGKPLVSALSYGACQGCIWGAVCAYIKGVGQQLGQPGMTCTPLPKGERVTWLKGSATKDTPPVRDVIGVTVPTKPDALNGVVLYDYVKGDGYASTAGCTLPATDHKWCTDILNFFVKEKWLM